MFLRENEVGRRIAPHLEPGERLLDLGSGTGLISRWLARRIGVVPATADLVDYGNRVTGLPFLAMDDPVRVPVDDGSFDVVMMLFVLHHMDRWTDQEALAREAARAARRRVIVLEDTPTSRLDRVLNVGWDWLLNLRHGVPTPFTFRTVEGWREVFDRAGLSVTHLETYRARWPTLMTYHHTLFVLSPIPIDPVAVGTMPACPSPGPTIHARSPTRPGTRSARRIPTPRSSIPRAT